MGAPLTRPAWLGALVACMSLPASLDAAHSPDAVGRKLGSQLLRDRGGPAPRAVAAAPAEEPWRRGSRVHVYVRVRTADAETLGALRRAGLEIVTTSAAFGLVDGWVEAAALQTLAELPSITMIRPVAPPVGNAGAVVTAGDAALGADQVRAAGFTGAGVAVAVISDGVDSLATSQGAGELPAVTLPADPRCAVPGGDEGTAMLEIVHDVAPGAALLFASFGESGLQGADSVRCLAEAGARVIVDDVTYPDEPFFQEGPMAAATREVVGRGVSYHTSAGNRRREFVEQPFFGVFIPTFGVVHDFAAGRGDLSNEVLVGAQSGSTCSLQWDEPFGAAATDLDLHVFLGPNEITKSDDPQDGTQDPLEVVRIPNPTESDLPFSLVVRFFSGDPQRLLRILCFQSAGLEHVSLEGAIYEHQAVPEVIAVASIDVEDDGHDTTELSSSPGPARLLFPTPEVREKPDLASFDGVATSVPGFEDFHGTSAAAPHTAAVAALMLSKNPALTPAQIQQAMMQTAVDIEAPGFDHFAGAGRLDALAAVGAVPCSGAAQLPEEVSCGGEKIPRAIAVSYRAARRRLARAESAPARRARKLLRDARTRAAKSLVAVERRAAGGKLGPGCAAAVRGLLVLAERGAACRLESLGG
jgi:subtilisin family serine protease